MLDPRNSRIDWRILPGNEISNPKRDLHIRRSSGPFDPPAERISEISNRVHEHIARRQTFHQRGKRRTSAPLTEHPRTPDSLHSRRKYLGSAVSHRIDDYREWA